MSLPRRCSGGANTARESAGVDTRLSNEVEGFETPTGRQ